MKPKIRHTLYVVITIILTTTLFMVKCQGLLSAHQIRPIATESEKVRPPGEGVKLGTGKNMNYRMNTQ
jgi:hypothetical protein